MNLLDKYIVEVGKHLPHKNRLDLQTEIRSTLEDMLEDRSKATGKPADEALVSEVLAEFGAPSKVAAAYQPTRYLIGPRLYPFFTMVVKIVMSVLTVVSMIGFGIAFASGATTGAAFLAAFGKWIVQFVTGIISAFGNIVLVFAILERVLPASEFKAEEEKWAPADLDAEPDPDEAKRSELIFEILFTMLGLAVLNLYPQIIGIAGNMNGTWYFVPALTNVFFRYLPWINLLSALQIVLDLFLLRKGLWQTSTRLTNLALEVGGIALAIVMLRGPALVDASALANTPVGGATEVLIPMLNFLPVMVLSILIIVQSVEALQIVWKLISARSAQKTFLPQK